MRYRSAWACRSAIYVRWAQKKGALVARPSGGAEVVPARGALFRPESAGREGQRWLLLIIPAPPATAVRPEGQPETVGPRQPSPVPAAGFPRAFPGLGALDTRFAASVTGPRP